MINTGVIDNLTAAPSNNFLAYIRSDLLEKYNNNGESNESIHAINLLAKEYHRHLQDSSYYQEDLGALIADVADFDEYQTFNIINDEILKLSLHIMPRGTEIPMHAHPGKFNLIMVEKGNLQIEQRSLGSQYIKSVNSNIVRLLFSGDTCVGLPVRNNMHQLKALSDHTVFFSLRISSEDFEKRNSLSKLFSSRFIAPMFCLIMIPALFLHNQVSAGGSNFSISKKNERSIQGNSYIAAKNRESNNHEQQVEAVLWYKKSAMQGNAESQYWLGVMNLEGSGITEDDYEALKWISLSANQGYPPAEKLLSHLLNTDFEMDC